MEQLDYASELALGVVAGTEHHVSNVFDAQGVVHFDLVIVILLNIWHVLNAMIDRLPCDSQIFWESKLQVSRVRDILHKVWKLVISHGQITRSCFTLFYFFVVHLLVLDNELVQSPVHWVDKQQSATLVPKKSCEFLLEQATQIEVTFAYHELSNLVHNLIRSFILDLVFGRVEDLGEWLNEECSHYSESFPVTIRVKRDWRAFAMLQLNEKDEFLAVAEEVVVERSNHHIARTNPAPRGIYEIGVLDLEWGVDTFDPFG